MNNPDTDHWDTFDEARKQATEDLDTARDRYQKLTKIGVIPADVYATALGDTDEDITLLDDVLDVSPEDAHRAEEVADRALFLADILDVMWKYHTELIKTELSIYETWSDGICELPDVDSEGLTDTLNSLTAFTENDNYGQIRSGDHFTVFSFRRQIIEQDEEAQDSHSAKEYVTYCIETLESFEDEFTDDLKKLVKKDVPISIKSDRKSVSDALQSVYEQIDKDTIDSSTIDLARAGLEGSMILKYQTSYELLSHEYCRELADIVNNLDSTDGTTVGSVDEYTVDYLERMVATSIENTVTVSKEDRVVDLLRENNKRVSKALAASDFDDEQFFEALRIAFETDLISDLEVELE